MAEAAVLIAALAIVVFFGFLLFGMAFNTGSFVVGSVKGTWNGGPKKDKPPMSDFQRRLERQEMHDRASG